MTGQFGNKNKAWSARVSEPVSDLVKRYTASVDFDQRLAEVDIRGSLAHAAMLAATGILSESDLASIQRGFTTIREEIAAGRFEWSLDLEDVHLNIEKRLTELVGDAGKRLHTARSRNDQVATDIRLWLRDATDEILALLRALQEALLALAEQHADTIMPGFTHLQVAQPVTFGHHLLAYVEMLSRDAGRLADTRRRINRLPLGAAALAGTTFPIDREHVARTLGFDGVCENSLDAVSDRDFAIEFCADASLLMMHLSRFSEELVNWMSPRVGFIDLSDRYCTGSSIMPQKKNPDVAELARGKAGRLIGDLTGLLAVLKGLPLAYDRDLQEDKEPVFDAVDTLAVLLPAVAGMIETMTLHLDRMAALAPQGFSLATDVAERLVQRGVPFRSAHEISGACVRRCEERGVELWDLTDDDFAAIDPRLTPGVREVLSAQGSVSARRGHGGTAPVRVAEQLARAIERTAGLRVFSREGSVLDRPAAPVGPSCSRPSGNGASGSSARA